MSSFVNRIIRAAMLDVSLYEEVEADKGAMKQAIWIVILSSIAAGIGNVGNNSFKWIAAGTAMALIGWYLWAYLVYFIGTKILPEPQTKTNHGELLRTIAFSSSPGLIRILGIVPGLGRIIFITASVWMIVAMVIAVRQALDYKSTVRAVGVCVAGWTIQAVLLLLLLSISGGSPIATP